MLTGWAAASVGARIAAATATASALGIASPIHAGLLIVPAPELTSLMPLTPGTWGSRAAGLPLPSRRPERMPRRRSRSGSRCTRSNWGQASASAARAFSSSSGAARRSPGGWRQRPQSRRVATAAAGLAALGAALLAGALIAT
jgi:hypothetical protein